MIKDAENELKGITNSHPNFWNLVTEAAFEGFKLFEFSGHQGKTDKMIADMGSIYLRAWDLRGSLRKAENIIGHFEFVHEILQTTPEPKNEVLKLKLENNIDSFQNVLVNIKEIFNGTNG